MEIFYTKTSKGWKATDAEGHSAEAVTKELAKNQLSFLYHNKEIKDFSEMLKLHLTETRL